MKVCPRCHFYNVDKNTRCIKCGWILEPPKSPPERKPRIRLRPFTAPVRTARKFLRNARRIFRSEIPEAPYRYPYLAAGLSLLFGLGQVYNRQYKKALFFSIGYIIGLAIVIPTITKPYSNWLIFLFVAFALYTYNDGLVTAVKINGQQWTLRYTIAAYFALFFILGMGTVVGQFFFIGIFKLIRVTQPTLAPVFHKGDMVFVDCITHLFRSPHRGEIIFYTPEPFQIEKPGELDPPRYYIHERRTFERIVGLPGDVVERKKGYFYLNGKLMPNWCEPLLPENIPSEFHFKVPEGRYLAIFSHSPRETSWGPSFGGRAPPLNAPGIILIDWDKTCIVTKKQIFGRALFVFNPPTHRRFLLPP